MTKNNSTKKRILFFIPAFPVTSETFIEREVYKISMRKNLDIAVLSLKKDGVLNYSHLNEIVTYVNLNILHVLCGSLFFMFTAPSQFIGTLNIVLSNKTKPKLKSIFLWIKSLGYSWIIRQKTPDILHCHFMSEISTIGLIAARLLNIEYSISGHARDIFETYGGSRFGPELVSQKISYAKFAVLCNKKAYEECLKLVEPHDRAKVHLEYHGLDFDKLSTLNPGNKNDVPTLFFAGRFVEKKGLMYLLEALLLLVKKDIHLHLNIIGLGNSYNDYKNFVTTNNLNSTVNFINDGQGTSNDILLAEMNLADIVIVPSIDTGSGDADGIPNTILEAGMLSKPVISTNAGSISEIIMHEKTGLVVDQKDPQALAVAIERLVNDPKLASDLGTALFSIVKENFNADSNIIKLENLFTNKI